MLPQTKTKVSEHCLITGTDESAILILLGFLGDSLSTACLSVVVEYIECTLGEALFSEIEVEVIWSGPNPYGLVQLKQQIELSLNAKWTVLP